MREQFAVPPAIDRGFVRILRGSRPVGCGFIIADGLVCTCAHVVAQALGHTPTLVDAPKEPIHLDFPRLSVTKSVEARVTQDGWSPLRAPSYPSQHAQQDLAILELQEAPPHGARPLEVSRTETVWGHPFGAYGYPVERPEGVWVSGQLLDTDDIGLIQIEATKQTGYFAQPGFSGTPIWDTYEGAVVGIIAIAESEPDKLIAFAIPTSFIEHLKPGILGHGKSPIERLSEVVAGSPPGYRSKLHDFFSFYLGTTQKPRAFGGRATEIDFMNKWALDASDTDRLLLVGPSGTGKSSLLTHWAAQLPRDCIVILIPISIRHRTNRAETVFRALAARLAAALGGHPLSQPPADPAGYYMDLCREYLEDLGTGADQSVTLILDGLDEGAGFDGYAGIFPSRKLRGVKIVVSARLTAQAPDVDSWIRHLNWDESADWATARELSNLSLDGLEDVILQAGPLLAELAQQTDIIPTLYDLTQGDPLLLGLYIEDLLNSDDLSPKQKIQDLKSIPRGFSGYFKKWFTDQRKLWGSDDPLLERDTHCVLAALACALGPLRANEIERILEKTARSVETPVYKMVEPLKRFVIGRPDTDGYVLSHPKLGEFLRSPDNDVVDSATVSRVKAAFVGWGQDTLKQFAERPPQEQDIAECQYLLSYYTSHLMRENAGVEQFLTCIENGWRQAWFMFEGGYRGFAQDVARALDVAKNAARLHRTDDSQVAGDPTHLAGRLRCALCLSSIRTIGANIPDTLIRNAVDARVLTHRQAVDLILFKVSDHDRGRGIAAIAPCLVDHPNDARLASEFLLAASTVKCDDCLATAIVALVPLLPQSLHVEVMDLAERASKHEARAKMMLALGKHSSGELQTRAFASALAEARSVKDPGLRAFTLTAMTPFLPEMLRRGALADALEAAGLIELEAPKAHALLDLVPHLSEADRPGPLDFVLTASRSAEDPAALLRRVSEYLSPQQVGNALATVLGMWNGREKADALGALAGHLSAEQMDEAVSAARKIADGVSRAKALLGLTLHLSGAQRDRALTEVTRCAWKVQNLLEKAEIYVGLATQLSGASKADALNSALITARTMRNGEHKARLLINLAPELPDAEMIGTLKVALAAALGITDDADRLGLLDELATICPDLTHVGAFADEIPSVNGVAKDLPHLVPSATLADLHSASEREDGVRRALAEARAINDDSSWANALVLVAPHLSDKDKQRALLNTQRISDKVQRASAMIAISYYVSSDTQAELLNEAVTLVASMTEENYRAAAVGGLALHLSRSQQDCLLARLVAVADSTKSPISRVRALQQLLPFLPKSSQTEAISAAVRAVREISSAVDQVELLGILAASLSIVHHDAAEMGVLAIARAIRSPRYRAKALQTLLPFLPQMQQSDVLAEALAALKEVEDQEERGRALVEFAPYLMLARQPSVWRQAVIEAAAIPAPSHRARAFEALALFVVGNQQAEAFLGAVNAVRSISNEADRAHALLELAAYLFITQQPDALSEVADVCKDITNPSFRAKTLLAITPFLAGHQQVESLADAVKAAGGIANEEDRARLLIGIAPLLVADPNADVLREAARAASSIVDSFTRRNALHALLPAMSLSERSKIVGESVSALRLINDEGYKGETLTVLSPHLSEVERGGGLDEALAIARSIHVPIHRAKALGALAPYLSASLRDDVAGEVTVLLRTISDKEDNLRTLIGLAQSLSGAQREETLTVAAEEAEAIGDPFVRSTAIELLVPHLPMPQKIAVLSNSLVAIKAIANEEYRSYALNRLIPHLSTVPQRDGLENAVAVAKSIQKPLLRARSFGALMPVLPTTMRREILEIALQAARRIGGIGYNRARTLSSLAPYLPMQERHIVEVEARETARRIEDVEFRARALGDLAVQLPDGQREKVMAEAIAEVQSMNDTTARTRTIGALTERTQRIERVHTDITDFQKTPANSPDQSRVLTPPGSVMFSTRIEWTEAVASAFKAMTLIDKHLASEPYALCPSLAEDQRERIEVLRNIVDPREGAASDLDQPSGSCSLPGIEKCEATEEFLDRVPSLRRAEAMTQFANNLPAISKQIDKYHLQIVGKTIVDIVEWWP